MYNASFHNISFCARRNSLAEVSTDRFAHTLKKATISFRPGRQAIQFVGCSTQKVPTLFLTESILSWYNPLFWSSYSQKFVLCATSSHYSSASLIYSSLSMTSISTQHFIQTWYNPDTHSLEYCPQLDSKEEAQKRNYKATRGYSCVFLPYSRKHTYQSRRLWTRRHFTDVWAYSRSLHPHPQRAMSALSHLQRAFVLPAHWPARTTITYEWLFHQQFQASRMNPN